MNPTYDFKTSSNKCGSRAPERSLTARRSAGSLVCAEAPEEIGASVLWLCSPGASFVVGVALLFDGEYTAR
jgi:hypothetical protein